MCIIKNNLNAKGRSLRLEQGRISSDFGTLADARVSAFYCTFSISKAYYKVYDDSQKYQESVNKRNQAFKLLTEIEQDFALLDANAEFLKKAKRTTYLVRFYLYEYRGRSKLTLKNYIGAIEDFDNSIHLSEEYEGFGDYDIYSYRGYVKSALKDFKGALADYNQYVFLRNKSIRETEKSGGVDIGDLTEYNNKEYQGSYVVSAHGSYRNRGIVKYELGDKTGACEDFQQACELGDRDACERIKRVCN